MLESIKINDAKNVKVHGRTVVKEEVLPLFWNHSGVEVNCDGSELWIDLDVDNGFHEPWIAIEINGALMSRRMLLKEDKSVCLFRSMTKGVVKNVKFYRELQAMHEDDNCHVLVKGFRTDGEFLPVEDGKIKLEFIGDSISSGEGTYGALQDTDWLAMYMSSSRHYASIIEKAMKADVRIISQGGWGIYVGWDNDLRHNLPSVYEPVCGLAYGEFNKSLGALEKNDFNSWVPDAIIVNLGTNDNSAFNSPAFDVPGIGLSKMRKNADSSYNEEDIQKVKDALYAFLKDLRRLNPSSHILWAYGMLGVNMLPVIEETIMKYSKETGDKNINVLRLPVITDETVGSHSHPGFANHREAARIIGAYLENKFGIEYKEPKGNL